jgi:hypothetical protein
LLVPLQVTINTCIGNLQSGKKMNETSDSSSVRFIFIIKSRSISFFYFENYEAQLLSRELFCICG